MDFVHSPLPLEHLEIYKTPKLLTWPAQKLGFLVDPKGGSHPGNVAGTEYLSSAFLLPMHRLLLRRVCVLIEGQMGVCCPSMSASPH